MAQEKNELNSSKNGEKEENKCKKNNITKAREIIEDGVRSGRVAGEAYEIMDK